MPTHKFEVTKGETILLSFHFLLFRLCAVMLGKNDERGMKSRANCYLIGANCHGCFEKGPEPFAARVVFRKHPANDSSVLT